MAARTISHYCSSLDSLWPPVLQSWVLCFPQAPGTSPQSTARILRLGLERTIMQRPYLAGIVSRDRRRERLMVTYRIQGDRPDMDKFFSVNDLTIHPSPRHTNSDSWPQAYNQLRQRGMPVSRLLRDRLEPYGGFQDKLNTMPIAAQANFIPGGCLLSITLHHSLFDGFGAESIVEAWARNCKEVQQHDNHHHPEEEIQILTLPPSLKEPHPPATSHSLDNHPSKHWDLAQVNYLWELLGMQNPHTQPSSPPALYGTHYSQPSAHQQQPHHLTYIPAIFTASANSIARLKANSTPPSWALAGGTWPEISTTDAVASLLWRSILAARLSDLVPSVRRNASRLRIPVSIRKPLQVSPSYPGNCLLNAVTSLPIDELVSEPDGERTSPMIRASILAARSPANARAAIQLSRATSASSRGYDAGGLGLGFGGMCSTMPVLEKRVPLFKDSGGANGSDLVLTSWRDLGYYRHDWGDMFSSGGHACDSEGGRKRAASGRPEFVRVPANYLPGVCILLPSRDGVSDGIAKGMVTGEEFEIQGPPLDVLLTMPATQLDRLRRDREFSEYFSIFAM